MVYLKYLDLKVTRKLKNMGSTKNIQEYLAFTIGFRCG